MRWEIWTQQSFWKCGRNGNDCQVTIKTNWEARKQLELIICGNQFGSRYFSVLLLLFLTWTKLTPENQMNDACKWALFRRIQTAYMTAGTEYVFILFTVLTSKKTPRQYKYVLEYLMLLFYLIHMWHLYCT